MGNFLKFCKSPITVLSHELELKVSKSANLYTLELLEKKNYFQKIPKISEKLIYL